GWTCRRISSGQLVIPNRLIAEPHGIFAADAAEIFHDGVGGLELFEEELPVSAQHHHRWARWDISLDARMIEHHDSKPRLLVTANDDRPSSLIHQRGVQTGL